MYKIKIHTIYKSNNFNWNHCSIRLTFFLILPTNKFYVNVNTIKTKKQKE